jgi:hypothetical protein
MYEKLVAGTENDKHDNHEIISIENKENAEKPQSHEEMRSFLGMDKLVFIFKGNQNLLKQRRVSRALPPSALAV